MKCIFTTAGEDSDIKDAERNDCDTCKNLITAIDRLDTEYGSLMDTKDELVVRVADLKDTITEKVALIETLNDKIAELKQENYAFNNALRD